MHSEQDQRAENGLRIAAYHHKRESGGVGPVAVKDLQQ